MRTVQVRMMNNQVQRVSCDQLLATIERQLPQGTVQQEVERGVTLPLSSRLDSVKKTGDTLYYTFRVLLNNYTFRISKSAGDDQIPEWVRRYLRHANGKYELPMNESVGIIFNYQAPITSTTLITANLKAISQHLILPNIYGEKKLCFGRNNARPVDCGGDYLKEVETAINIFLGGTFNSDLSSLSLGGDAMKQRVITFFEREHPNLPFMQNVRNTGSSVFTCKLFLTALASVAKVDLVKFSEVVKGGSLE